MKTSTQLTRLSPQEIEHYNREGYAIPAGKVFRDQKFLDLANHFDTKLAALPEGERPEAMDVPHFTDPKLNEWALAPEVIDLVEPLIGPDIILFSTHFICKPGTDGRRVPWHEDSAYWRRMLDPIEVATVWLAIDPSTTANGCMNVIPRTHATGQKGFSDYEDVDATTNVFGQEIIPSHRKDELAVPIELQPNHCSLHDGRLQHSSQANTSGIRRCGYTMRFMPATTRLSPNFHDRHVMYLARGRNVLDQPLADPTKSYDTLYAERLLKKVNAH
jgi:ectoine hydroxylase-related dioxygenase (phytanoyl-CoA dioxygenase family)